ncbi:hypothetical protein, partial [Salmonella sp. s54925]|uniref:hypothetical protein n=1 Tax=Salmonella sp. s54925 TaxID=3159674 RepID=UPI00397FDEEE
NNPNNLNAQDHFDGMKKQWEDNVESLTNLVDQGTDRLNFLEASEDAIKQDIFDLKSAAANDNPQQVAVKTTSAARRANRVVSVAQLELDNSEDPRYVATLII